MLSHFVNRNQTDWDEYLPFITMAYNSQGHESTGFSPYEMVFGRKMEASLEADLTISEDSEIYGDHVEALRSKLKTTHELAAKRKAVARKKNERQYNKKAKTSAYKVGQMVYLHVPSLKRHRTKKLAKLWKGPYRVVEVLSPLTVVLRVRKRDVIVHVNRIKPCPGRTAPARPAEDERVEVEQDEEVLEEQAQEPAYEHEELEIVGVEDLEDAREPAVAAPEPSAGGRPQRGTRRPKHLDDFDLS